jgi:hypothetical protein
MDRFVAHANIDHYLDMLQNGEVSAANKSMITRLLIEEVDKLDRDWEQLEFAESRAATCRDRADRQRRLVESLDPGSSDRAIAGKLLLNFESLAECVEGACQQMRRRLSRSRL